MSSLTWQGWDEEQVTSWIQGMISGGSDAKGTLMSMKVFEAKANLALSRTRVLGIEFSKALVWNENLVCESESEIDEWYSKIFLEVGYNLPPFRNMGLTNLEWCLFE